MRSPLIISAVIGVIVSVLKNWNVDKKYYFIVAILLGISYYLYWYFQNEIILIFVIEKGIIAGGTASGIYSGVKTISNKKIVKQIMNPLKFERKNNGKEK